MSNKVNYVEVAECGQKLYYDINPDSRMDVPAYFFGQLEAHWIEWNKLESQLSFYEYCKDKLMNKDENKWADKLTIQTKYNVSFLQRIKNLFCPYMWIEYEILCKELMPDHKIEKASVRPVSYWKKFKIKYLMRKGFGHSVEDKN